MLKRISDYDVQRICANQVIVDLSGIVKELVENSLDAQSTSIEIRLSDYGSLGIEVSDNGSGIKEVDFDALAKRNHTSKIDAFDDLATVCTFGFRGEALHALCTIARLNVTTATADTAPKGFSVQYASGGEILTRRDIARCQGTTVQVSDIFYNLPVRQKEFKKNIRKEFSKCVELMQHYATSCFGARFTMANVSSKGSRNVLIQTKGSNFLRENVIDVYGMATAKCLFDLRFEFTHCASPPTTSTEQESSSQIVVSGLISKPHLGCGRASRDRQMFFLNRRPVDLAKVGKAITEVFREFVPSQCPIFVINLSIKPGRYDINFTPDKRTFAIEDEDFLVQTIRDEISKVFRQNCSHGDMCLSSSQPSSQSNSQKSLSGEDVADASHGSKLSKVTKIASRGAFVAERRVSSGVYPIPELIHADSTSVCSVEFTNIIKQRKILATRKKRKENTAASASFRLTETPFIQKCDFEKMEIIGQFNLGFIIALYDGTLYIIDQHAADEKFRYETLKKTAITTFQPLVRPLELLLSPTHETIVRQSIEGLKERGFHINIDEHDSRLTLVSAPQVKDLQLDVLDLEEIISKMESTSIMSVPHCKKVQRFFASKACRYAVMIGDPLSASKMRQIINHMGLIDQPWNCPHGRPTIRICAFIQ